MGGGGGHRDCGGVVVSCGVCVPYKSGKIWAPQVQTFTAYHALLTRIKAALDPAQILSPGNLGLGTKL